MLLMQENYYLPFLRQLSCLYLLAMKNNRDLSFSAEKLENYLRKYIMFLSENYTSFRSGLTFWERGHFFALKVFKLKFEQITP